MGSTPTPGTPQPEASGLHELGWSFIFISMSKKRVLSGIRATGRLHLGNYLGAVKGMFALQENPEYETFYMVADLHAITTPYDKEKLRENAREVVKDYLAAGLDPEESVLFLQSDVPEHVELSYLFSTQVTVARLSHLPTYKDKVRQYPENNTLALLYYPALMAADILIYKADSVPVGDDQEPHLEVAREIARKMEQEYGVSLSEPTRFVFVKEGLKVNRVPSLTGEGKMSKSIKGSYINLTDDFETIKDKIAKVPTDEGKGNKVPEEGGVASLLTFVELFEGKEKRKAFEGKYKGDGIKYSELKNGLSEAIFEELKPLQEKRNSLDDGFVDEVLEKGAEKARKVAKKTLSEVREAMGIK